MINDNNELEVLTPEESKKIFGGINSLVSSTGVDVNSLVGSAAANAAQLLEAQIALGNIHGGLQIAMEAQRQGQTAIESLINDSESSRQSIEQSQA